MWRSHKRRFLGQSIWSAGVNAGLSIYAKGVSAASLPLGWMTSRKGGRGGAGGDTLRPSELILIVLFSKMNDEGLDMIKESQGGGSLPKLESPIRVNPGAS